MMNQNLISLLFVCFIIFTVGSDILSPFLPSEEDTCETWINRETGHYGGSCKSGYWWQCGILATGESFCWDSKGHIWQE